VAQVLEHLPSKCEALSSNSSVDSSPRPPHQLQFGRVKPHKTMEVSEVMWIIDTKAWKSAFWPFFSHL
jgi:hypothetical protein